MNGFITRSNYWIHLPRAFVSFTGLYVFHLLSGDALASWSLIGLAALALLARITGSLENRITRIELSIVSTACVLVFLQGGFIAHFNSLSLPLIMCTAVLLVGLNTLNISLPQARIVVVPILFVLFFVSQRYFYPSLTSEFSNPLLSIGLLVAAWELLSSLTYEKRASPTITETGTCIALLFFYYHHGAHFPTVALLSVGVLFAYYFGVSQTVDSTYHSATGIVVVPSQRNPIFNQQLVKPYAILIFAGLFAFSLTSWIAYTRAQNLPFLASLDTLPKPLEIEQRNRVEQAFFAFKTPESKIEKPLKPLNISILEEALQQTAKSESSPNRRKVIVRKARNSDRLNVGNQDRDNIQTTRILKIPTLRISPIKSSQSLPGYDVTEGDDSINAQYPSKSIQYDFGFESQSIESASTAKQPEKIAMSSAGGPIRLNQSNSSVASRPTQSNSRNRNASSLKSPESDPRDVQDSAGFSQQLKFAANVSTELNPKPVLEVFLPGSSKWINSLYLRFNTLEDIKSDRFVQASQHSGATQMIDRPGWNNAPESFRSYSELQEPWTLALGYEWKDSIPLLGHFESIKIPSGHSFSANEASFTMQRVSGSGPFAYQFRGPNIADTWSLGESGLSKSERERLTSLPLSSKEISYLKRLGARIGGKNPSPENFARKAGSYFENTHPYAFDFEFNPGDEHLLISWLKSRSPGICGYYAGAFTLLARAQGIPARVVIGALTREFDSKSRKFVVRDRDAHAWAEYLNENSEWVRADLTPIALDSPRFASTESNSEIYAKNIQSALTTLNSSIEVAERLTIQDPIFDLDTQKNSNQLDTSSNPLNRSEIVPSTATLVDKVLARENENTIRVLEATAALATEFSQRPTDTNSPPSIESEEPILQTKEYFEMEDSTDYEAPKSIDAETIEASVSMLAKNSWSLSPRVAINYLFVLLLVVFTFSQLRRIKKHNGKSVSSTNNPILQDRARAGRLLKEIEAFFGTSSDLGNQLLQIKQRALQLRYSPKCSAAEVKALKQEFRRSVSEKRSRS